MISLMVGMVLSMIVILMMLATYKVSVIATANAAQDAAADAQTTYAIMRASMAAQEAGSGYLTGGWVPAVPQMLHVLSGATISGSGSNQTISAGNWSINFSTPGNAVFWSWWDNAADAPKCSGLLYDSTPGTGGLFYLQTAAYCNDVTQYPTNNHWSSWKSTRLTSRTQQALNTTGQLKFTLSSVASGSCSQFGLTNGYLAGSVKLTISTTNSSGASLTEQTCLINFP